MSHSTRGLRVAIDYIDDAPTEFDPFPAGAAIQVASRAAHRYVPPPFVPRRPAHAPSVAQYALDTERVWRVAPQRVPRWVAPVAGLVVALGAIFGIVTNESAARVTPATTKQIIVAATPIEQRVTTAPPVEERAVPAVAVIEKLIEIEPVVEPEPAIEPVIEVAAPVAAPVKAKRKAKRPANLRSKPSKPVRKPLRRPVRVDASTPLGTLRVK